MSFLVIISSLCYLSLVVYKAACLQLEAQHIREFVNASLLCWPPYLLTYLLEYLPTPWDIQNHWSSLHCWFKLVDVYVLERSRHGVNEFWMMSLQVNLASPSVKLTLKFASKRFFNLRLRWRHLRTPKMTRLKLQWWDCFGEVLFGLISLHKARRYVRWQSFLQQRLQSGNCRVWVMDDGGW